MQRNECGVQNELGQFEVSQKRRLEDQKATMQADFEERRKALARAAQTDRELEEHRLQQQKELLQIKLQSELSSFEQNLRHESSNYRSEGGGIGPSDAASIQRQVEAEVCSSSGCAGP